MSPAPRHDDEPAGAAFIVTHCAAEPEVVGRVRPLTGAGREQARDLGSRLAEIAAERGLAGPGALQMISSPALRCLETAFYLGEAFAQETDLDLVLCQSLLVEAGRSVGPDALHEALSYARPSGIAVLVTHSSALDALVKLEMPAGAARVGALVMVDTDLNPVHAEHRAVSWRAVPIRTTTPRSA